MVRMGMGPLGCRSVHSPTLEVHPPKNQEGPGRILPSVNLEMPFSALFGTIPKFAVGAFRNRETCGILYSRPPTRCRRRGSVVGPPARLRCARLIVTPEFLGGPRDHRPAEGTPWERPLRPDRNGLSTYPAPRLVPASRSGHRARAANRL